MLIKFSNIVFSKILGKLKNHISGLHAYGYTIIWTPKSGAEYYFISNAWSGSINDNSGYLDLSEYDSASPLIVTVTEVTDDKSITQTIKLVKQGIGYYIIGDNFFIAPESSDNASIGSYIIGLNFITK